MATYYFQMVSKPTCLYRFYDADERLLYVGISKNLGGRIAKHKRTEWWPLARYQEVVWFPDRESAKSAERHAIRDEHPVYNLSRPYVGCC